VRTFLKHTQGFRRHAQAPGGSRFPSGAGFFADVDHMRLAFRVKMGKSVRIGHALLSSLLVAHGPAPVQ